MPGFDEDAPSTRDRLVAGALECLRRDGPRFSFADVARASGVARQTIYAHFADRDELLGAAVDHAARALTAEVARATADVEDVAEALVETVVHFHGAARTDPAIAQVIAMTLHPRTADSGTIPAAAMRTVRGFVRPRVADDLDPAVLDGAAEVFLRFLLSVLSYSSASTETPQALRAFCRAHLVPALGLPRR